MALDNGILEATANGPAAPNPLATAGAIQQAKLMPLQQQEAQNQLQTSNYNLAAAGRADQAAQQQTAAAQAARTALAKNTTIDPATGKANINRGAVLADMATNGFTPEAIGLSQQWSAGDEAAHQQTLKDTTDELKNRATSIEQLGQVIGPYARSITPAMPQGDPQLWAAAKQQAIGIGIPANSIPDAPNPQMALQEYGQATSAKEQVDAAQKQIDQAREQQVVTETGRHNLADEANAAATAANTATYQKGELGVKYGELALAKQKQAMEQADPKSAGALLASGDATLSELKTRGATPQFITQALNEAHRITGGQYNAQQADAQFSVAKSPAQVAFFGSSKSLTDPGGTLDQLAAAAKDIPNGQIPVFNSVADAEKAATGSGPIAKYASLLVGVSDDYSKVMGGGTGSDSSRNQALSLVPANASPDARAAAIEGIRGAVNSQTNSRIGSNPILKRMYGAPNAAPAGTSPSSYAMTQTNAAGRQVGSNDGGKTWTWTDTGQPYKP